MRIAVISDIHGNLIALDTVLDDMASEEYDDLVCLGDVALRGPEPRACLERLQALGCQVVMGNTDEWLVSENPSWCSPDDRDPVMAIDFWTAQQLTSSDLTYLRSFKPAIEMPLSGAEGICFFHGSPRSNTENILSITAESDLEQMIVGCKASVLVGGHTHLQLLRRKYDKTIVNVGSVGLPFLVDRVDTRDLGHVPVAPWAEYAIISHKEGRLSVDFRRVHLDVAALERSVMKSRMPHGDWWFSCRDMELLA